MNSRVYGQCSHAVADGYTYQDGVRKTRTMNLLTEYHLFKQGDFNKKTFLSARLLTYINNTSINTYIQ